MITTSYEPFGYWEDEGSSFVLSDLHFSGQESKLTK